MTQQKAHLNQADIEILIEVMKINFVSKSDFDQFKSNIYDKLDLIIKNTTTTNEELLVTQSVVSNHTIQVRRLEDILSLPAIT